MPGPPVFIVEYLLHISRDDRARKHFQENPDQAMKDFGLDDNQRKAVQNNDPKQLEETIVFELSLATSSTTVSMTTKTTSKL